MEYQVTLSAVIEASSPLEARVGMDEFVGCSQETNYDMGCNPQHYYEVEELSSVTTDDHIYMASWTGGYDIPSFYFTRDYDDALEHIEQWSSYVDDDDDSYVELIQMDNSVAGPTLPAHRVELD